MNTDPHVWVTKDDRCIHVDDMDEDHVRNALKLILRRAHEGRIWAIKPETGGLRHYNKENFVARVEVKKVPPKVLDVYDTISSIKLELSTEEAKALIAVYHHNIVGNSVGTKAYRGIVEALYEAGLPNVSDQKTFRHDNGNLDFVR